MTDLDVSVARADVVTIIEAAATWRASCLLPTDRTRRLDSAIERVMGLMAGLSICPVCVKPIGDDQAYTSNGGSLMHATCEREVRTD